MDPRIISEVVFWGNFMMMLSKVLFLDLGASSTSQNSVSKEIKKPTPPLIPLTLDLCTKVNPGIFIFDAWSSLSQVSVRAKTDSLVWANRRLISGNLLDRLRQFK